MTQPMIEARVGEVTEALVPDISTSDLDDAERVTLVPAAMIQAFEHGQRLYYDVGLAIVAYADGDEKGGQPQEPLPPHTTRIKFGDPRHCWNPVRHLPHTFHYQVGDRTGRVECDGSGDLGAQALGFQTAAARAARQALLDASNYVMTDRNSGDGSVWSSNADALLDAVAAYVTATKPFTGSSS